MNPDQNSTWFQRSRTCYLEGRDVHGRSKLGTTEQGRCTTCWRDGFGTLFARIKTENGVRDVYASTCKIKTDVDKDDFKPGRMVEYNFAGRRYEGRVLSAGAATALIEHADPLTGGKSAVKVPRSHILKG
jgi:hypothetical protein